MLPWWIGFCLESYQFQPVAVTLQDAAKDAACLAYWLSSIQPIEHEESVLDSFAAGTQSVNELIHAAAAGSG